MAVGKKITSAFSGPADVNSFDMISHVPSSHTIKQKKSAKREELENLYKNIRNLREGKSAEITLKEAFAAVTANHENDWLLSVEIAELAKKENNTDLIDKVLNHLEKLKINRPEVAHLIDGGLELIFEKAININK
jgi:phenylalanine-4-hydroxylase